MITRLKLSYACYLLLLIMSLACSSNKDSQQAVTRPVLSYRVTELHWQNQLTYAAEVKADYETQLSFRVSGKMLERLVKAGDSVHKGQLLAKLDASDYLLNVQNLKAQVQAAQVERDFNSQDLARQQLLLDKNIISPPEFDRHKTQFIASEQKLAALQAQLASGENQLKYTQLTADKDGVIGQYSAETGQLVVAGQPVFSLLTPEKPVVWFDVPEQQINSIKTQQTVTIAIWANSDVHFNGIIHEIAPSADPASRSYRVKAELSEPSSAIGQIKPGMTATVSMIQSAEKPQAYLLPLSAVFSSHEVPEQHKVWLIDEHTHTVKSLPVQIAEVIDTTQLAVTGISHGQLLVSAGVQRLAENQAIRLANQP